MIIGVVPFHVPTQNQFQNDVKHHDKTQEAHANKKPPRGIAFYNNITYGVWVLSLFVHMYPLRATGGITL
jgi:hypothetical protein